MSDLTVVINLVVAFLLGGAIGWVREMEGRTAGLMTHILVSVGSALFMITSVHMLNISPSADPGRIAAGVVMGVGFIGAGCILQGRQSIRGITSATSIWIAAAVGMACGISFYVGATTTTIITIITLRSLRQAKKFIKTDKETE